MRSLSIPSLTIVLISLNLLACGDKSTDSSELPEQDSGNLVDPGGDEDGDGVHSSEDCDDQNPWVQADCNRTCSGDFSIESDEDLPLVAGCALIDGNLNIDGLSQTDLIAFNSLTKVTGYVWIFRNAQLTSLHGLEQLTEVGAEMAISYNDKLPTLEGLSNLTSVGASLSITSNADLSRLQGMDSLEQVGRSLYINNLPVTDLDGFTSLTTIGSSVYISECDVLTDLMGLSTHITSVGESDEIGTPDEEGYPIQSYLYVTNNERLCQNQVVRLVEAWVDIGWTGMPTSYGNDGACN